MGRGYGVKPGKRDYPSVRARVSASTLRKLKALAILDEVSISEIIRRGIAHELDQSGLPLASPDTVLG